MKKNKFTLFLFIMLGLLAGTLLAQSLESIAALNVLTQAMDASFHPAANLLVFSFDLKLKSELSLLSIIGAVIAIWLYRKY